ncbi:MAG: PIG-L deacetylase family protein [Acidimicrobiales bacterium]
MGGLIVDRTHLGPSEAQWAASPHLGGVATLTVPDVDRVVVVAPHPDDEILGSGGLLQVLAQRGVGIEVGAVSDGDGAFGPLNRADRERLGRVRTAESERALSRLGVGSVPRARLGLADGRVAADTGVLMAWLARRLTARSLCLAPWEHDGHPDHDAAGAAAAEAALATGAGLLRYVVWGWHWADPAGTDIPWAGARRLELTRRQAARKRWAIGAFASQWSPPHLGARPEPVMPAAVLRRFWRRWELYLT